LNKNNITEVRIFRTRFKLQDIIGIVDNLQQWSSNIDIDLFSLQETDSVIVVLFKQCENINFNSIGKWNVAYIGTETVFHTAVDGWVHSSKDTLVSFPVNHRRLRSFFRTMYFRAVPISTQHLKDIGLRVLTFPVSDSNTNGNDSIPEDGIYKRIQELYEPMNGIVGTYYDNYESVGFAIQVSDETFPFILAISMILTSESDIGIGKSFSPGTMHEYEFLNSLKVQSIKRSMFKSSISTSMY